MGYDMAAVDGDVKWFTIDKWHDGRMVPVDFDFTTVNGYVVSSHAVVNVDIVAPGLVAADGDVIGAYALKVITGATFHLATGDDDIADPLIVFA